MSVLRCTRVTATKERVYYGGLAGCDQVQELAVFVNNTHTAP